MAREVVEHNILHPGMEGWETAPVVLDGNSVLIRPDRMKPQVDYVVKIDGQHFIYRLLQLGSIGKSEVTIEIVED